MSFSSGSILWVKCGQVHWPGKFVAEKDYSADLKESLKAEKRKPKFVVKFFDEDGFQFVYDDKNVFPYNCPKKEEFIKKVKATEHLATDEF